MMVYQQLTVPQDNTNTDDSLMFKENKGEYR